MLSSAWAASVLTVVDNDDVADAAGLVLLATRLAHDFGVCLMTGAGAGVEGTGSAALAEFSTTLDSGSTVA